jgi:hypothetical protein
MSKFKPIQNDKFKTSDGRTFKVINLVWNAGIISDIDFIQVHEEPEPTEIIRKPYYIMKNLFINKKIILL